VKKSRPKSGSQFIETGEKKRRLLPGLKVADGFTRHPFDGAFGLRTSGLIPGRHLKSGHPHDRHATAYFGVAPSVFRELLRRWRQHRPAPPIEQTTFIDLGAGMGRAMLIAALLPFRAVMGVELNPALVRLARQNMTRWRKVANPQAPMRLVCGDAAECVFPSGPCVAFLFNPFGATVMRRLLKGMARSFARRPRELDILYINNEQESVLEAQPGFVRLFHGQVKRSRQDAKADFQIMANQPDGEYASADYEDCSIWRWVGKPGPLASARQAEENLFQRITRI
jgi:SAM-dependent methyltransferase